MPWTLYRYILKDLLKLLVFSTVVLVLVIAFAVAIKPMSDGLLGPAELLRFVIYSTPTVLPMALPFAAAFAATLVFSRLAGDNEILVCRAAGMSYVVILLPVLLLGLALMLTLFVLSSSVVPSFYESASRMVEKDMTRVVVSQVKKGRPVPIGNLVLYADDADDTHPPPELADTQVQPFKLIMLRGVAAGQMDRDGRLRSDSTAQKADVLLYDYNGQTWATVRLENAMVHNAARGDLLYVEEVKFPPVRLPSPFRDDPRFLSRSELRRLSQDPQRYDRVRDRKVALAKAIAARRLADQITAALVGDAANGTPPGAVTLLGARPGERYELKAPSVQRSGTGLALAALGGEPIRIDYHVGGLLARRITAAVGQLRIEPGDPDPEPRIELELTDARVTNARLAGPPGDHKQLNLPASHWPQPLLAPLREQSIDELMALVRDQYGDDPALAKAYNTLRNSLGVLIRTVLSQLHARVCMAIICLFTVVVAAMLAMKMTTTMPLVVFIFSFVLTLLAVIITRAGDNVFCNLNYPVAWGIAITWSGNVLLAATAALTYWRVSRT